MTIARHHTEWLSLIEISGPFVSLPVLSKVFPQGLDERDPERARNLRSTFEAYQEAPNNLATQLAWVKFVLSDTLSFYPEHLKEGQEIPPGLKAELLEHRETLRPDIAVVVPRTSEFGEKVQQTQLLVSVYLKDQDLDAPIKGTHWKASPATRMAELLHASDVPLGLVTNGERWMLVYAPRGETTGFTSWYASLWFEEPKTLRAFHSLLSLQRLVGSTDTLLSMLRESAKDQQEVTDKLGRQVRDAVDVLVTAFSRLNVEDQGKLLEGISEKELYNAALTVMMRLVFLFCAEERGMLHLGKPLYDNNYAVSTLREQLQEDADQHGEEVLERRSDAWVRLLATFRAVYGGVTHEDLSLPAYGGSLFDPDRYTFLEGRPIGSVWTAIEAIPPKINNRVVLHLLRSLQMLQENDGQGGSEARRLSFRSLDIEQIGHVYEGLLDHTVNVAKEVLIGIKSGKNQNLKVSLLKIESILKRDEESALELLGQLTDRTPKSIANDLKRTTEDYSSLEAQCRFEKNIFERIKRIFPLLSFDSFGDPIVIFPEDWYVTGGEDRRSSGTHYTPRLLSSTVVREALQPMVYHGPREGLDRAKWKLKGPEEILSLKICDIAMGSGAFLVEACRYLSEKLVEAWEIFEQGLPNEARITPFGNVSSGVLRERLLPKDPAERLMIAKRLVADRCLYGVDINPMAVEMAKLSLWLVTMQKDRPFGFLDHALRAGDSLIGIHKMEHLQYFSTSRATAEASLASSIIGDRIQASISKRVLLESMESETLQDLVDKQILLHQAQQDIYNLKLISDCIVGIELRGLSEGEYEVARIGLAQQAVQALDRDNTKNLHREYAVHLENRQPFHWLLEFPEVILNGGFDAILGNPPFAGGTIATANYGVNYMNYITSYYAPYHGKADYVGFFVRLAAILLKKNGCFGLLATASLVRGETVESSIMQITKSGQLYRALSSFPWPGAAKVSAVCVWFIKGHWEGELYIDNNAVTGIGADLEAGETNIELVPVDNGLGGFLGVKLSPGNPLISREQCHDLETPLRKGILPAIGGAEINQLVDLQFADLRLDEMRYSDVELAKIASILNLKLERKQIKHSAPAKELRNRMQKTRLTIACPETTHGKLCFYVFEGDSILLKHKAIGFPVDHWRYFALLQSTIHEIWAWKFGLRRKEDLVYLPKRCSDTFPNPKDFTADKYVFLDELAKELHDIRDLLKVKKGLGLTKIYNRYNDPLCKEIDILQLRDLHQQIDYKIGEIWGLNKETMQLDFEKSKNGMRYTFSESNRLHIINILVNENLKMGSSTLRIASTNLGAKREMANLKLKQQGDDQPTLF